MASYRFCRPDDVPLLVGAVNACWDVHFPAAPRLDEERFLAEVRELDVWPSNCMVARDGAGPLAVSIATKRPHEVLVRRLGVRPGWERRGHASHLLASLSQKLAVLGPPRLVAEVPHAAAAAGAFFDALGWTVEATLTDWQRPPDGGVEAPPELVIPVTVGDLEGDGVLAVAASAPWERSLPTLRARQGRLRGVAVATPERIEAYLLALPAAAGLELAALGCRDGDRREALWGLLVRHLAVAGPLRLPKVAEEELPPPLLAALGFAPADQYDRRVAPASPG